MIRKPQPTEYNSFYQPYIDQIDSADMVAALKAQSETLSKFFLEHSDKAEYKYAADKWSIKEILNHMNDTERVFAYRAMCIVRGEKQELPGFDQNSYQDHSHSNLRTLESLVKEFEAIRLSSILFFENIPESESLSVGIASGFSVSVRALAAMIVGHADHHIQVIRNKYL